MPERGTAVVTGGASGIGAATCQVLVEDGYKVAILDIHVERGREMCASLGGNDAAIFVECDVTSELEVYAAFAEVAEQFTSIEALINSAGIIGPQATADITDGTWQRLLDVHLGGAMRCSRAAYPFMSGKGGAIVNLSSIAARFGLPGRLAYCAAKSGIEGLTRSLAVEWASVGIRVNAVAPGYVMTQLVREAIDRGVYEEEAVLRRVPLERFGEPGEIAEVIAFLASTRSSFVTGQTIVADGGLIVNGTFA